LNAGSGPGQRYRSQADAEWFGIGSTWTLTDGSDAVETYTTVSATEAILSSIKARNGYTQTLQYGASTSHDRAGFLRTVSAFFVSDGLMQTLTTPTT